MAAATAPGAYAGISASQITTPADGTYLLDNNRLGEGGPGVPVAGTISGEEAPIDLVCYTPAGRKVFAESVPVEAGSFSASVPRTVLDGLGPCVLRAVPHGDLAVHAPGSPTPFAGPRIAPSSYEVTQKRPWLTELDSSTFTGHLEFTSPGFCGLANSFLVKPTTLAPAGLFFCNDAIFQRDTTNTRSELQIDGANAYTESAATFSVEKELQEKGLTEVVPGGLPPAGGLLAYDPTTGLAAEYESGYTVKCSPAATVPVTLAGCKSFSGTDVVLDRTWQTSDDNHIAWLTDTWTSTDGAPHSLNVLYFQKLQDSVPAGGLYEFPGQSAFAATTKGESIPFPPGPGAILFKTSPTTPEGGDGEHAQGAIVYDSAPSGPAAITEGSDGNKGFNSWEMPYVRTIPAAGSYTIRMAFIQGFSLPEVKSRAEAAIASFYPTVTIATPANGSTIATASPSVTVSGIAADGVADTQPLPQFLAGVGVSALTVNGEPVAVGAGGAWSTTVPLSPGANTITAVATNQAGLSRSATVAVTYIPPATVPPATASQAGDASGANGVVTFTIACHGMAGTSCTVHGTLTTVERIRHKHVIGLVAKRPRTKSETITVGRVTVVISAGEQVKLTLKLTGAGRKLLALFHRLPAHLSVMLEGPSGGMPVIVQNITVKPTKHDKRKR
jgi:hypothetical protein